MKKIGLTGGIGSGKTTVAKIFEILGIPVYYADDAAKRLMNNNDELKSDIIKNFGKDAYHAGALNRKYLADQVFIDKAKINLLNSLVHPITLKDANEWMALQTSPYIIKEAALLFESGSHKQLDYVIGIKAPLELRIQRAIDRDQISAQKVEDRINKQLNEDEKLRLCDYVIVNDEEHMLLPRVLELHEKFLEMEREN